MKEHLKNCTLGAEACTNLMCTAGDVGNVFVFDKEKQTKEQIHQGGQSDRTHIVYRNGPKCVHLGLQFFYQVNKLTVTLLPSGYIRGSKIQERATELNKTGLA